MYNDYPCDRGLYILCAVDRMWSVVFLLYICAFQFNLI